MSKNKFYLLLLGLLICISCNQEERKEDMVNEVNKESAIETELSVTHIDSADILVTKHKVWKDNKLVREIVKKDTIPNLGKAIQTVKDERGEEHAVNAKKDYEFYITVQ